MTTWRTHRPADVSSAADHLQLQVGVDGPRGRTSEDDDAPTGPAVQRSRRQGQECPGEQDERGGREIEVGGSDEHTTVVVIAAVRSGHRRGLTDHRSGRHAGMRRRRRLMTGGGMGAGAAVRRGRTRDHGVHEHHREHERKDQPPVPSDRPGPTPAHLSQASDVRTRASTPSPRPGPRCRIRSRQLPLRPRRPGVSGAV